MKNGCVDRKCWIPDSGTTSSKFPQLGRIFIGVAVLLCNGLICIFRGVLGHIRA